MLSRFFCFNKLSVFTALYILMSLVYTAKVKSEPIKIGKAQRQFIEQKFFGTLVNPKRSDISSYIEGEIESVFVEEGELVVEGQILAELDQRDAQVNLKILTKKLNLQQHLVDNYEIELEKEKIKHAALTNAKNIDVAKLDIATSV